jgi:hypothetical protein
VAERLALRGGAPAVHHDCDPVVVEEVAAGVAKVLAGLDQLGK